jgi:hypothetical protein
MATTLTALQSDDGIAMDYVVAVEGYGVLLCSGSSTAALTAWAGTDWSEAVSGLCVSGQMGQKLDPWKPFGDASELTLSVVPCPGQTAGTDRFGEDVWNRTGGTSSELTTSVDCNDTSIVVKRADDFDANGTIYVDNEAMAYSSRDTGTKTFTISTRGKWSPFTVDGGGRFAHPHRLSDSAIADGVLLPPEVTTRPRSWVGRWVGVWIHRKVGGVLDTKAEAHLAWAGRITDVGETESGVTTLTCQDVRASVADAVILRDQYRAKVREGIYIPAGVTFSAYTERHTSVYEDATATNLVVVSSGASGVYQMNAGYYRAGDLTGPINAWLNDAFDTGGLLFSCSYKGLYATNDGFRAQLRLDDHVADSGGNTGTRRVQLSCSSPSLASALGWGGSSLVVRVNAASGTVTGTSSPMRVFIAHRASIFEMKLRVTNVRGTWVDQSALLPADMTHNGNTEGILKLGQFGYVMAYADGATGFRYFPVLSNSRGLGPSTNFALNAGLTEDDAGDCEVSQVLVAEGSFASLVGQFLSSTGTSTFNNTYDLLSETLGCGIPHSLIDTLIDSDLPSVSHSDITETVLIEGPTKFAELFAADFILRKSFLVWSNGQLRLTTWATPTAGFATVALTEANKAAPYGTRDAMRSSAVESTDWMRNVVKIQYGRRADGSYDKAVNLEDAVSVRRHGAKPVTIEARNLTAWLTTSVLDEFISEFSDWMPVLSRPVIRIRRTIARTLFESAIAGAQATITDEHVRDWSTGLRGVTGRAALVVGHWYDYGASEHGENGPPRARGPAGEVEVLMYPSNLAVYVPCAQVNEGEAGAGYTEPAGVGTLVCHAHQHSESSEAADATRFVAGDRIRIVEIDPADPASPTTWDRIVATSSGNTITLTATLSAPVWDSAKYYRIIFDTYGDAQASQQTKCYQADDADGLIADTLAAYELGSFSGGQSSLAYTAAAASELPARYAQLAYGDGVGLDVGYEFDIAKLANNLGGYKTACQAPQVYSTGRAVVEPAAWTIVECRYIYVGAGQLGGGSTCKLYVAPRLKVDTATGYVRVSLSSGPPSGSAPSGSALTSVSVPLPVVSQTFSTTSTSYEVATTAALDMRHLPLAIGVGFLIVEVMTSTAGVGTVTYDGLSVCYVGALESI